MFKEMFKEMFKDDEAQKRRWLAALDALCIQDDSKPLAELLRRERVPMFVQKQLASLLDPKSSPVIMRLKLERSPREVRKRNTLMKRENLGREIYNEIERIQISSSNRKNRLVDSVIAVFQPKDSVIADFQPEERPSRSYLHKCYEEYVDMLIRMVDWEELDRRAKVRDAVKEAKRSIFSSP
jgi:hypothetical protein